MKERFGNILVVLASAKICCVLPPLLALVGIGASVSIETMDTVQMFTLPFIAWPATLYANWRLWRGLYLSKKNGCTLNWHKVGWKIAVTVFATLVFLYFFITAFIPLATAPRLIVCKPPFSLKLF